MTIKRRYVSITAPAGQEVVEKILEGSTLFKRIIKRVFNEARADNVNLIVKINEETFINTPTLNLDQNFNGMVWEHELVPGEWLNIGLYNRTGASITYDVTIEYDEEKIAV